MRPQSLRQDRRIYFDMNCLTKDSATCCILRTQELNIHDMVFVHCIGSSESLLEDYEVSQRDILVPEVIQRAAKKTISARPVLWRILKACNRATTFEGPRSRSTSLMYRGDLLHGSVPSNTICRCWIPEIILRHWQIESSAYQSAGMPVTCWNGLRANPMNGSLERSIPWRHGMLDKTSPLSGSEGFEENEAARLCRMSQASWKICLLQRMAFSMQQ